MMAATIDSAPMAETLKAFAHPIRLMILQELAEGTKCVTDMEELLPAKQANISQHLSVLRNARLVDFAQDGALRCYYLARPKLVRDILRLIARDEPLVKRTAAQIKAEKVKVGSR
ncbi:MAG: ArsR/SmtB family transcription factor [Pirellulaceae bacterium]